MKQNCDLYDYTTTRFLPGKVNDTDVQGLSISFREITKRIII